MNYIGDQVAFVVRLSPFQQPRQGTGRIVAWKKGHAIVRSRLEDGSLVHTAVPDVPWSPADLN